MFDTASSGGQSIEVLEEAWRASGGHAAFFAVLLTSGGAGASRNLRAAALIGPRWSALQSYLGPFVGRGPGRP